MRKRRASNLNLSSEMIHLADSYFKKKCYDIDNAYRMNFSNVKLEFMRTRNYFTVHRTYVEWAEAKVKARIETYIDAYKREGLIPSDGDINEIKWDLQDIILNVAPSIPVDTQAILEREKMRIIESACHDINIFTQETELERKKAEARKPEQSSSINYTINIGENRGPIQQGGQGNTQNLEDRNDDETKH